MMKMRVVGDGPDGTDARAAFAAAAHAMVDRMLAKGVRCLWMVGENPTTSEVHQDAEPPLACVSEGLRLLIANDE